MKTHVLFIILAIQASTNSPAFAQTLVAHSWQERVAYHSLKANDSRLLNVLDYCRSNPECEKHPKAVEAYLNYEPPNFRRDLEPLQAMADFAGHLPGVGVFSDAANLALALVARNPQVFDFANPYRSFNEPEMLPENLTEALKNAEFQFSKPPPNRGLAEIYDQYLTKKYGIHYADSQFDMELDQFKRRNGIQRDLRNIKKDLSAFRETMRFTSMKFTESRAKADDRQGGEVARIEFERRHTELQTTFHLLSLLVAPQDPRLAKSLSLLGAATLTLHKTFFPAKGFEPSKLMMMSNVAGAVTLLAQAFGGQGDAEMAFRSAVMEQLKALQAAVQSLHQKIDLMNQNMIVYFNRVMEDLVALRVIQQETLSRIASLHREVVYNRQYVRDIFQATRQEDTDELLYLCLGERQILRDGQLTRTNLQRCVAKFRATLDGASGAHWANLAPPRDDLGVISALEKDILQQPYIADANAFISAVGAYDMGRLLYIPNILRWEQIAHAYVNFQADNLKYFNAGIATSENQNTLLVQADKIQTFFRVTIGDRNFLLSFFESIRDQYEQEHLTILNILTEIRKQADLLPAKYTKVNYPEIGRQWSLPLAFVRLVPREVWLAQAVGLGEVQFRIGVDRPASGGVIMDLNAVFEDVNKNKTTFLVKRFYGEERPFRKGSGAFTRSWFERAEEYWEKGFSSMGDVLRGYWWDYGLHPRLGVPIKDWPINEMQSMIPEETTKRFAAEMLKRAEATVTNLLQYHLVEHRNGEFMRPNGTYLEGTKFWTSLTSLASRLEAEHKRLWGQYRTAEALGFLSASFVGGGDKCFNAIKGLEPSGKLNISLMRGSMVSQGQWSHALSRVVPTCYIENPLLPRITSLQTRIQALNIAFGAKLDQPRR